VPIDYTNRGGKTFSDQESTAAAVDFAYDDLVKLSGLMGAIMCQADYVAMS
jgi:hypothetical protein